MSDEMPPSRPWIAMTAGIRRRTLASGAGMMQMVVEFEARARLPEHRHVHEQVTFVVSGKLRLTLHGGTETHELTAGESFYLASNVLHAAEAPEEATVLDTFNPPREDLLDRDREG